ncbi:hypothetical protein ASPBRDRAFT_571882 [Aspergillus brasiliensis CBS 101740]|uniref:Uncharacterized protein n=1 Tax=Aspergillus brasiliensis (strain CBS 101740 / IMI 381727 / IBT 21946) TaxID=767769 RepID=A0A1L9UJB9_ASPBC|nr:hypothetical protein ASPBRDRAFT_571882 [Aspergillus brasiliensis CBS 101740]
MMTYYLFFSFSLSSSPLLLLLPDLDCLALGTWYMGMFLFLSFFLPFYSLRGIQSSFSGACSFQREKKKDFLTFLSFSFLKLIPLFSHLTRLSHAAGTKYSIFIIYSYLLPFSISLYAYCLSDPAGIK